MGNSCCEHQDSKERELGLTRPVNTLLKADPNNLLSMAGHSEITKTKSESTGDQQTTTFWSKSPIIILKEARGDPRDLLRRFAGSPEEQIPAQNPKGSLKPLFDPMDELVENQQSSSPQSEGNKSDPQKPSEIAIISSQFTGSRFKQASNGGAKGAAGSKNDQTTRVRITLRNLRN